MKKLWLLLALLFLVDPHPMAYPQNVPSQQANSNNVRYARSFPGATPDAKIAACLADLGVHPGTCYTDGVTGTFAATLTMGRPFQTLAVGPGTLDFGSVSPGIRISANNVSVIGAGRGRSILKQDTLYKHRNFHLNRLRRCAQQHHHHWPDDPGSQYLCIGDGKHVRYRRDLGLWFPIQPAMGSDDHYRHPCGSVQGCQSDGCHPPGSCFERRNPIGSQLLRRLGRKRDRWDCVPWMQQFAHHRQRTYRLGARRHRPRRIVLWAFVLGGQPQHDLGKLDS